MTFAYGNFIQSVVDFLIVAFTIFLAVKLISKAKRKEEKEEGKTPQPSEQQLLTETGICSKTRYKSQGFMI